MRSDGCLEMTLQEKSIVSEWFDGCTSALLTFTSDQTQAYSPFCLFSPDKTHEFRRLAMGRLLDDLQRKLKYKADHGDGDPLKLLVHTTHVRENNCQFNLLVNMSPPYRIQPWQAFVRRWTYSTRGV